MIRQCYGIGSEVESQLKTVCELMPPWQPLYSEHIKVGYSVQPFLFRKRFYCVFYRFARRIIAYWSKKLSTAAMLTNPHPIICGGRHSGIYIVNLLWFCFHRFIFCFSTCSICFLFFSLYNSFYVCQMLLHILYSITFAVSRLFPTGVMATSPCTILYMRVRRCSLRRRARGGHFRRSISSETLTLSLGL